MGWSISADKRVIDAIVGCFSEPIERCCERLSALNSRDWERSHHWIVASGMALYFLDHLQTLGIEGYLPPETFERFSQDLSNNRKRSASMMDEFTAINRAFLREGVRYCNVKGFTLSPDYCPHPALRNQLDLDLVVDERDIELCRRILVHAGYVQMGQARAVWEFRTGASEVPHIEDHFKPGPQRSVELHFLDSELLPPASRCDPRLDRIGWRAWHGENFPVLSPADQFIGQAFHLFSHLRSASTRVSWLLEYKRFVLSHGDRDLWNNVREYSAARPGAPVAIGLATYLSTAMFGGQAPAQLDEWTLDLLPPAVRLWADRYGRASVLAGSPGTKLYLILEGELATNDPAWSVKKRSKLLPLHNTMRITFAKPNEGVWGRFRRELYQARFLLFRARFHLTEGLRYLIESQRWKRTVAAQEDHGPFHRNQEMVFDEEPNP